jgi:hypothetical protein
MFWDPYAPAGVDGSVSAVDEPEAPTKDCTPSTVR